jgi:hypothetical protein
MKSAASEIDPSIGGHARPFECEKNRREARTHPTRYSNLRGETITAGDSTAVARYSLADRRQKT